jgi:hypothetical protein
MYISMEGLRKRTNNMPIIKVGILSRYFDVKKQGYGSLLYDIR